MELHNRKIIGTCTVPAVCGWPLLHTSWDTVHTHHITNFAFSTGRHCPMLPSHSNQTLLAGALASHFCETCVWNELCVPPANPAASAFVSQASRRSLRLCQRLMHAGIFSGASCMVIMCTWLPLVFLNSDSVSKDSHIAFGMEEKSASLLQGHVAALRLHIINFTRKILKLVAMSNFKNARNTTEHDGSSL
jgi:hypothetical protein